MSRDTRRLVGWLAVATSTSVACFWGFWGGIETFHEGWFYESLLQNLALTAAQYLLPMLGLVTLGLAGVRWPRLGSPLHAAAAVALVWIFKGRLSEAVLTLLAGPMFLLAVGYWYGRPQPRSRALLLLAILPLATAVVCGAGPAVRVATRIDDGYRGSRRVAANGVDLTWAPEGPGWPRDGVSWGEASRRCRFLAADGRSLADTPQNIWRLPTVDEAVRSQARHGANSRGAWNGATATYVLTPDKESPLWDVHSPVIYWWTGTELDADRAFIIVYDGTVRTRPKAARWGSLGFRAVR